jgi:hypothetical protein
MRLSHVKQPPRLSLQAILSRTARVQVATPQTLSVFSMSRTIVKGDDVGCAAAGAEVGATGFDVGATGVDVGATGFDVGATGIDVGATGVAERVIGLSDGVRGAVDGAMGLTARVMGLAVGATGLAEGVTGRLVGETGLLERRPLHLPHSAGNCSKATFSHASTVANRFVSTKCLIRSAQV